MSMRSVADVLGVATMSLYQHVAGRDAILDGIVEKLLVEIDVPGEGAGPESMHGLARSLFDLGRRHPNCVLLIATSAGTKDSAFQRWEATAAPAPGPDASHHAQMAFRTYLAYALGFLLTEVGLYWGSPGHEDPEQRDPTLTAAFELGLDLLDEGALLAPRTPPVKRPGTALRAARRGGSSGGVRPPAGGMGSEGSWALEARMELESDAVLMKAVRVFLDEVVTEWKLEMIRDDALLVATELATNAVPHAGTKVRVTLSSDGAGVLRIEVRDLNTRMPSPAESSDRSAPSERADLGNMPSSAGD